MKDYGTKSDRNAARRNRKRGIRKTSGAVVPRAGDGSVAFATGVPCPRPDKARHLSRRAARRNVKRISPDRSVHPYKCPCGFWHLGTGDDALRVKRRTNG